MLRDKCLDSTTVSVIILVPLWYLTSAASVVLLKEVFQDEEDPLSTVLDATIAYLISGVIGGWMYQYIMGIAEDKPDTKEAALTLATAFDIIGTAATNWAIVEGGASLSQVFKLLEPPITVVIAFLVQGEKTSPARIACILFTCSGVYLARHQQQSSTPTTSSPVIEATMTFGRQIVWTLGLCIMTTSFPFRNVYAKRMRTSGALAYAAICKRGLQILAPVSIGRFCAMPYLAANLEKKFTRFCLASIFSAIYNLFSFKVLAHVSPVTHAQLRLGKRAVSLVISVATLHDVELTISHLFGLVLAFAGLVGFLLSPKSGSSIQEAIADNTNRDSMSKAISDLDPEFATTEGDQSLLLRDRCTSMDKDTFLSGSPHEKTKDQSDIKDHHLRRPAISVQFFSTVLVYLIILFLVLGTRLTAKVSIHQDASSKVPTHRQQQVRPMKKVLSS